MVTVNVKKYRNMLQELFWHPLEDMNFVEMGLSGTVNSAHSRRNNDFLYLEVP